jgi:hypothetical protein
MATTTNYGWTTPNDTDLVKDGAAAIRTLGSSVDTTTKALNPSTTLGDIEYRSSTANTNTRLGIGTSGQVLTVSSGVPAWVTASSGGMTLLSTTTLSGASTTISSIDQTYVDLLIVMRGAFYNTVENMTVRPNSVTASGFYTGILNSSGDTTDTIRVGSMPTSLNAGNSLAISINQYASTTNGKPLRYHGTINQSNSTTYNFAGLLNTTSAITSLVFFAQGSSTFSGGSVLIYGVK